MTIDKNPEQLMELLTAVYQKDYKWVYYSGIYNTPDHFTVYKQHDEMIKDEQYGQYKPIVDVLRALDPDRYCKGGKIDDKFMEAVLKDNTIQSFNGADNLKALLVTGDYCPVNYVRQVMPDEINRFCIYEHTHPGHQVYELGHDVKLTNSFTEFKEAVTFFNKMVFKLNSRLSVTRPDVVLLADFKKVDLSLDEEGYPLNNTGLLIKSAYPFFQNGKPLAYRYKDNCDFNLCIKQPVLARVNNSIKKIEYCNAEFEAVNPKDQLPYIDLRHFSLDPVMVTLNTKHDLNTKPDKDNPSRLRH